MPWQAYDAPSNHLRRSHSALSVADRRKHYFTSTPVESEIPRQHALIAANIAMERSTGSASGPLSRESSRRSTVMQTPRSLRFAHEDFQATQPAFSQSPASLTWKEGQNPHNKPPVHVPPAYESIITTSTLESLNGSYGSQPSSYRRLRKAKSMIDTRKFGDKTSSTRKGATRSNITRPLQHASSSMSLRVPSLKLSLQRSFNMLRGYNRHSERLIPYQPELTCRPESIALARSEFLRMSAAAATTPTGGGSPQTPKSFAQNSLKSLRRSVRTAALPQNDKDGQTLQTKDLSPVTNRSLPTSLRSKIKRVFGKSTASRQTVPPQQLDASSQHFIEGAKASGSGDAFDSYCDADPELSRRNSLYIPSETNRDVGFADHDPFAKVDCGRSTNSLRSNSQSRITSWNNSLSSSGSMRGDPYDPKRLSVIKEDGGPHQPSSSAGRHVGGISVLQQPLQLSQGAKIDSQRVYSALLKRIDREQTEMEATKAALQEIHETQETKSQHESSTATVRRVPSRSSFDEMGDYGDRCSVQDIESQPDTQEELSYPCRSSARHRPHQNRLQEKYSTFFGASTGMEPQRPSPFSKLLRERRYPDEYQDCTVENVNTRIHSATRYDTFAKSSESIYSRTTNGGTNLDYSASFGSAENFEPRVKVEGEDHGIATIMRSDHAKSDFKLAKSQRVVTSSSMTPSEKGRWKGWIENQMAHLHQNSSQRRTHVRELAQVDSYDVGIGSVKATTGLASHPHQQLFSCTVKAGDEIVKSQGSSSGSITIQAKTPPMDLYVQAQSSAKSSIYDREERSGLKPPLIESTAGQEHVSGAIQASAQPLQIGRKTSANHLARVLRLRRSQPTMISHRGTGKENKPNSTLYATPVKKLDRLQTESQSTATDEGLQESNNNIMSRGGFNKISPSGQMHDTADSTPSNRTKTMLAARLSRPFDMDVPEFNRPFDSTYLGTSSRSSSQAKASARLSVAPHGRLLRPAKSYGGLGIPRLGTIPYALDESSPTALPQLLENSDEVRNSSVGTLAISSRRLVSNFLRSRRKKSHTINKALDTVPTGSPVFI